MYGSVGLAAGALVSTLLFDPDQKIESLNQENQKLKSEIDQINNPLPEFSSTAFLNSKIPDKYKNLISPGEWRVYKLDQWVEDGENRMLHQDKMMELIPPTFSPTNK